MRRIGVVALVLTALVASAAGAATINKSFTQTATVHITATPSGCENNPGPYITLNGGISLGGVGAKILLSNNVKFTHSSSATVAGSVALIPAGETITIAKQPSRGGVGGNPWIYFQFTDPSGRELCAPILLGRCVQGLTEARGSFGLPTGCRLDVSGGECSNSPGPFINLSGEIRLGGLNGRIILTNNAKFTHATSVDIVQDVVLLEDGKTITFAKQPPLGGSGGNPWIWVQFTNGSGDNIGSPILLGRCVQL